ncbi:MAG: hypothetical protein EB006_14015, partial [Betaproteobacteria bacterium]|nr:hypothetical protein [Betaproteobacteria bacterium]
PEAKTPADRREEARTKLAEIEARRAAAAKRVPEKAIPAERKAMERPAQRPPAAAIVCRIDSNVTDRYRNTSYDANQKRSEDHAPE